MAGSEFDAVVAGAGPAGAAAARDIARNGFRVLLLEEHQQVGSPSHCSGLVTPRTLQLAGVGEELIINQIRGAVVHSPAGRELAIGGNRLHAVAIDRARFDQTLAEQAEATGVKLGLGIKLLSSERHDGAVLVRARRGHREMSFTTRLLIGADGAQSRVAKWLGADTLCSDRVIGLGAEVRLRTRLLDCVRVFVGNRIAPGFFGWIIPLTAGSARLGIATNGLRRPIHYLRELMDGYPQIFSGADIVRLYGGLIPLKRLRRICADNLMLVGDAAGHIKPTSGGGIYTALLGARLCAGVACDALTTDNLSASFLGRYETAWNREMGRELERGWDLRQGLVNLSDVELERLLHILGSSTFRSIIGRYGDIDFPSRLALRLALQRPLLRRVMRVALAGPW